MFVFVTAPLSCFEPYCKVYILCCVPVEYHPDDGYCTLKVHLAHSQIDQEN